MDWRRLVLLPPPTSPLPPSPPSSFSPPPLPPSPPSPPSPPLHPPTISSSPLLQPSLAFARGTEVFPSSSASTSSAPVNSSVSLLRLLAAFTRSLSGHDRERGVLVPLPLPSAHHRRHHLRYRLLRLSFLHAVSARSSRLSLSSA